jgi:Tfp pilus assembly protein PilF
MAMKSKNETRSIAGLVALLALSLGACATSLSQTAPAGPDPVLESLDSALLRLEAGDSAAAASDLDGALTRINASHAGDQKAAQARSMFHAEAIKDFKGEPYERAMANYYRGLLYLANGEYDNAAASFRAGQVADAVAEDVDHAQDFALLAFLRGWAYQCLGDADQASDSFEMAQAISPSIQRPDGRSNLLVIAETGSAPVKVAAGQGGSELKYERGGPPETVRFALDGRALPLGASEDIFFQASTRGRRAMDEILESKATTQAVGDTMGNVAMLTGTTMTLTDSMDGMLGDSTTAGLGMMLGGLVVKGVASMIKPAADTRAWSALPGEVHVATAHVPPAGGMVAIGFESAERSVPVRVSDRCDVVFARSGSAATTLESTAQVLAQAPAQSH